jgi:DNA-binding transcriptional LysR family regulator
MPRALHAARGAGGGACGARPARPPAEERALNAVYLEGRVLPRKVRALIDFAAEDLRREDIL